LLEQLAKDCLK